MPQRIIVLGANGSLGSEVTRLALQAGHAVTAVVRNPAKLATRGLSGMAVHQTDITAASAQQLSEVMRGHSALINTAGMVSDGDGFVVLIDRVVTSAELLPLAERPVCWFLAGAGLLDLDSSGRRGLDLPVVQRTYWPHAKNYARLQRSTLDWRLLCPGPMVDAPPVGVPRLRTATGRLPVAMPAWVARLPGSLVLPLFARRMPEMIVSYTDAAALMLANLEPLSAFSRQRVGLALPDGMRGSKARWTAARR